MRLPTLGVTLTALLCLAAAAEEGAVPDALKEWRDPAYSVRYFLKVEAPGEAGAAGVQREPAAASILLPLEVLPGGTPAPVLLIAEDGQTQPVLARAVNGGKEAELAFATRPGLRRFCLYADADARASPISSPASFRCEALHVMMRGRSIPPELAYARQRPLTLDRFREIEARMDGLLGVRLFQNINTPECPFFALTLDQLGHLQRSDNPQRYGALYEGFLRAPVRGRYQFALDTPGMAQLLIDGEVVLHAGEPGLDREPFALAGARELSEGLHRVTLYYAEPNLTLGRTNMDLQQFGLRLHWQPPGAGGWMCVPAQAFPRALPAIVTGFENAAGAQPFVHLESVGHVRAGAHHGSLRAREYVHIMAQAVNAPQGARIRVSEPGADSDFEAAGGVLKWVPAGADVSVVLLAVDGQTVLHRRALRFSTCKEGARDVLDLEAELVVKAAPDFLYPDETGQIHLESLLSPAPVILPKERMEGKFFPPQPRPMGQFSLVWRQQGRKPALLPATPPLTGRQKLRLELPASESDSGSNTDTALMLQLCVADVVAETQRFRVVNSRAGAWAGRVQAESEGLFLQTASGSGEDGRERLVIVVPRELERNYRAFAPLRGLPEKNFGKQILFLGDPLTDENAKSGLDERLAQALPGHQWQTVLTPGPHRQAPICRMLAGLETHLRAQNGKLPAMAIVSLGGGDVTLQTPFHTFERALDVIVDRLRLGGVQKIVIAGVLPEPSREKQCQRYQKRVLDIQRQHHIEGIDIFARWMREPNWAWRYAPDAKPATPFYLPVPNPTALDEAAGLIKNLF